MRLSALREAFTVGKKYAGGGLEYHGKVGFFKLYTPEKHNWGPEEELRLVTVLTDEAEKATNALRKLGFKRQVHNVAIIDESKMGRNAHSARSMNAGLASDKGHGMLISRTSVRPGEAARVLTHEWGHKYWFQLTPAEQAEVTAVYNKLIVDPLTDKDAWQRVERKMSQMWNQDLEMNAASHLNLSPHWVDRNLRKGKDNEDDITAYLEGLKSGTEIEGTVKKPIEHVRLMDKGTGMGEGTLEVGDLVWLERAGRMWKVRESREHGNVSSRYLSPKMVIDHVSFRPEAKAFKAIQSIRNKGSIALLDSLPENTWKIIARNVIVNAMGYVPQGEFSSDYEDRANGLLEGGLQATIDAWWESVKKPKGKGPKDIRAVYLALRKTVKDRLEWEPFLKYQRPITKKNMAKKSAGVRRNSLAKKGNVHSAYGANNTSEYWATLVEYGAMGKPLDKASSKLLQTLGR